MSQVTTEAESGMTSFTVEGDTGANQTISDGDTLKIVNAAGGSIKTVGVATDELTIDLAVSGVSADSYTNTSLTVNNQGLITAASSGTAAGGPSEGSNQSLQLTWAGQSDPWICINEANYGGATSVTWTTGNSYYWWNLGEVVVKYYAVFVPKTANYDYTSIIGATTSGSEDLDFSLFASDSDGFPTGSSLLDWTATIADTTFQHRETSVASTALTKGLHWLAVGVHNSSLLLGNMAAGFAVRTFSANYQNMPSVTPFVNIPIKDDTVTSLATDDFSYYLRETSATSIPATIDLADIELGGQHRVGSFWQGKVIPAVYLREAS